MKLKMQQVFIRLCKMLKVGLSKIYQFGAFIGIILGKLKWANQRDLKHLEVVELYKMQILTLEDELVTVRADKEKYENMLFRQLGLVKDEAEQHEFRPLGKTKMSPGHMRNFLELQSKAKK